MTPSVDDYIGVVLGTPFSFLKVTGYAGLHDGRRMFNVTCLRCGVIGRRSAENILNHRLTDKHGATNYCGCCRFEHRNPGQTAYRGHLPTNDNLNL